jgi:hypothetical protein
MKDAFDRNTITNSSQIAFVYLIVVMFIGLNVVQVVLIASMNRRQKSKMTNIDNTAQLMMDASDKLVQEVETIVENSERRFSSFENLYSGKIDYLVDKVPLIERLPLIEKLLQGLIAKKNNEEPSSETMDDILIKQREEKLQEDYKIKGADFLVNLYEETKGKQDMFTRATNIAARNILKIIKKSKGGT